MLKKLKPFFWVSPKTISFFEFFSPIGIGGITLFAIVITKYDLSQEGKDHESIHFQQYLDCFVVGFIPLYLFFWFRGLYRGMSGKDAYLSIPFEQEAYANERNENYLETRKRFSWTDYI